MTLMYVEHMHRNLAKRTLYNLSRVMTAKTQTQEYLFNIRKDVKTMQLQTMKEAETIKNWNAIYTKPTELRLKNSIISKGDENHKD